MQLEMTCEKSGLAQGAKYKRPKKGANAGQLTYKLKGDGKTYMVGAKKAAKAETAKKDARNARRRELRAERRANA
jgi:hypothetical protein